MIAQPSNQQPICLDARIASLESLATQATLLAGFSYAVLRPDSVGAILADDRLGNLFGILISFCTVASFCSALWVVYLTGYATIRARVTFLQGTRTRAVDATINMLIETQNQVCVFCVCTVRVGRDQFGAESVS